MQTKVIHLTKANQEAALKEAADIIKNGGLVAFPTETVYGLGANALDALAVQKIYDAKGRPARNPIIVHVSSVEQAKSLVKKWPEPANILVSRYWPGPMTLIFLKRDVVPGITTANADTVALRMPANSIARQLIEAAGVPIAAPSANTSGRVSATTAQHVQKHLEGKVELILDGGPTDAGLESTVIDLTVTPPVIRRPGPISRDQISSIIDLGRGGDAPKDGALPSPGMLESHYAPQAKVVMLSKEEMTKHPVDDKTGVIAFTDIPGAKTIVMPMDSIGYAAKLYDALHQMDDANVETILIEQPPQDREWEAVNDRLKRAAA